jgi:hypothetical protein
MDVLSPRTIGKPDLLLTYLEWSVTALRGHGLQLECLPVLCVYGYIAKHLMKNDSLLALTRLWQGQLYADLGLWSEAGTCREFAAGSLRLDPAQEREFEQQIRQRELMRTVSEAGGSGRVDTSQQNPFIKVLRPLQEHEVWLRQAQAKMLEGDSKLSKHILHRALRHSRANDDVASEGQCLHLLSKLAGLEGNTAQVRGVEFA